MFERGWVGPLQKVLILVKPYFGEYTEAKRDFPRGLVR